MTNLKTPKPTTTAIGSLPHHNVDAALAFSFELDIPFLPQIPIRNPWEYMIPQALDGMPGLQVDQDGTALLDYDVWLGRSRGFDGKLLDAFSHSSQPDAFDAFEPSSSTCSSWQPFLWEIEERGCTRAKIQIAGPLTAQWSLRLTDGSPADSKPEVAAQIYRLVLARAIAMGRKVAACGAEPLIFLDEPALFGLNSSNPKHIIGLQELKIVIQALAKEGFQVGLHCCSDTDWKTVLGLGLNFVSLDTSISLTSFLSAREALAKFALEGGRLSLGVIPTQAAKLGASPQALPVGHLIDYVKEAFAAALPNTPELRTKLLAEALYTPACGLALHSVHASEEVLAALQEFKKGL